MTENRKHTGGFVSYLRVSTDQQGISGLGLEAQREAVRTYLNGGDWHIVTEFVEVESRSQLRAARPGPGAGRSTPPSRSPCRGNVSRLTRSVAFLSRLLEAGVDVRFCDLPKIEGPAGRFMLQQMAAVAELEAGMISKRTKDALAAAKARGVKLGGRREGQRLTDETRAAGRAAVATKATERANDLAPVIADIRAAGITSLGGIARELVARGVPTALGNATWQEVQVRRVLRRTRRLNHPSRDLHPVGAERHRRAYARAWIGRTLGRVGRPRKPWPGVVRQGVERLREGRSADKSRDHPIDRPKQSPAENPGHESHQK